MNTENKTEVVEKTDLEKKYPKLKADDAKMLLGMNRANRRAWLKKNKVRKLRKPMLFGEVVAEPSIGAGDLERVLPFTDSQ